MLAPQRRHVSIPVFDLWKLRYRYLRASTRHQEGTPPLDVALVPCNIPALRLVTIEWLDPNFSFSAANLAYAEMVLARAAAMSAIYNLPLHWFSRFWLVSIVPLYPGFLWQQARSSPIQLFQALANAKLCGLILGISSIEPRNVFGAFDHVVICPGRDWGNQLDALSFD
jgi:hypothetical protein